MSRHRISAMPKSKGRPPDRIPKEGPPEVPKVSPKQADPKTRLGRLWKYGSSVWGSIISVGAIGGLLNIAERGWDFCRGRDEATN
jgi:hypothetical protein